MNRILYLSALIALAIITASAQNADYLNQTNAKLEAVPTVTSQKACVDNSGFSFKDGETSPISSVRIDVEFDVVYKNTGQYPIILDKSVGIVGEHSIYQKNDDSTLGALMESGDYHLLSSGDPDKEGDRPSKRFVTLAQGQSFSNQTETRLLFDLPHQFAAYEDKDFFISLALFTTGIDLPTNNNLVELRERWLKTGYFWFEGIGTKPTLIHFPNSKQLTLCKE